MIRSYIKGIVRELLDTPQLLRERPQYGAQSAEEALSITAPSHMIFQIANGFVVVTRNHNEPMVRTMNLPVFCKTGEEISEAIIAGAVKEKMNINPVSSSDQIKAGIQRVTRTY